MIIIHLIKFAKKLVQRLSGDLENSRHFGVNSISDGTKTTTPMGRFFFNIMGSLAQMEREIIVERTRAGLKAARDRGRVGGPPERGRGFPGSIMVSSFGKA